MPFIETKTNLPLTEIQEQSLKEQFGNAIGTIGKSEGWLMLRFEGGCHLWFQGTDSPCAIAEVKLYGKADAAAYDKLTGQITDILTQTLGLPASRIYVKYEECTYWGFSGSNF